MSLIKGKNTKPELLFLKFLSQAVYPRGARYRKHYTRLPGSPDIVFVGKKIAIFIDGDFWHGYNYQKNKASLPKVYWVDKIKNNILRDRRINQKLKDMGWQVIRIWEHEIKTDAQRHVRRIASIVCKT